MTASYHPHPELLLAYAAGDQDEATALLIAAHASLCAECRTQSHDLEAVGGILLESLAPAPLAADALEAVLDRLPMAVREVRPERSTAAAPDGLPGPVHHYLDRGGRRPRWRWLAPGIQQALLVRAATARVRLLRIAAGTPIPHHGHGSAEYTLVLEGAYHDENGRYGVGDFTVADRDKVHRPVASAQGCTCMILSSTPMRLTSRLGRLFNPFLPF